jgi:hypothetical protein
VSAKKLLPLPSRVAQADLFEDLELIEDFKTTGSKVQIQKISFPYAICLNQECDLQNDFINTANSDAKLIHLAFAPVFNFEQFLQGKHWGGLFRDNPAQKRDSTTIKKIIDNEIPRYHYLIFNDDKMPELIIDFKHFFSINKDSVYEQLPKRLCSLSDLYRESISQRFSNYLSRIGLP